MQPSGTAKSSESTAVCEPKVLVTCSSSRAFIFHAVASKKGCPVRRRSVGVQALACCASLKAELQQVAAEVQPRPPEAVLVPRSYREALHQDSGQLVQQQSRLGYTDNFNPRPVSEGTSAL